MDQNLDSIRTSIPLLKGEENFSVWCFQVKLALSGNGVFDVVSGAKPRPVLDAGGSGDNNLTTTLDSWKKLDMKGQQIIGMSISPHLVKHIMHLKTSKEMWDKLHAVFQQKSEMSVHMLLQKFFNYSKCSGDSMADHVAKLEDIKHRLESLGEKISDKMLMCKILMSLPRQYSHFHSAWDSTDVNEKSLENLTNRLMMEETRLKMDNLDLDSDEIALFTNNNNNEQETSFCNYCKSLGHDIKHCEKLKRKEKTKKDCF